MERPARLGVWVREPSSKSERGGDAHLDHTPHFAEFPITTHRPYTGEGRELGLTYREAGPP